MAKGIRMTNEQREIHRKKRIIEYAERTGNIHRACRYFGVARSTFYLWRDRYREFLHSRLPSTSAHGGTVPDTDARVPGKLR